MCTQQRLVTEWAKFELILHPVTPTVLRLPWTNPSACRAVGPPSSSDGTSTAGDVFRVYYDVTEQHKACQKFARIWRWTYGGLTTYIDRDRFSKVPSTEGIIFSIICSQRASRWGTATDGDSARTKSPNCEIYYKIILKYLSDWEATCQWVIIGQLAIGETCHGKSVVDSHLYAPGGTSDHFLTRLLHSIMW